MKPSEIIAAFKLPVNTLVGRRIPKKLLLENGAPSAADKRHIKNGIEELFWVSTLKPTTIGVPEYRDEVREYLEIALLRFTLRAEVKSTRLMELVHRAIPYPLILLAEQEGKVMLSAAHKRWAQNESDKMVLDGELVVVDWVAENDTLFLEEFSITLALEKQPYSNLRDLYQGWLDTLVALKAARLSGSYKPAAEPEKAIARKEALRECERLDSEMARLRAEAGKEKQMARRVELNLELKRIETIYASEKNKL